MRPSPLVLAVLAALVARPAAAQDGGELTLFELDAALARETTVASGRARTVRETPGIVTILTRDDLLAMGVRDLSEVLQRVPGFQLGSDVGNTVGAGFRGIWGHEGKILFLVDGLELNDLSYGTFPLGNHVLVDQLERIEIIRGPGSAVYGGHAELAVVNVVTRAATVEGGGMSTLGAATSRAVSAGAITAAAGGRERGLRLGVAGYLGTGLRSDARYADLAGTPAELADGSGLAPGQVSAQLAWRGLEVRALYDDYRVETLDGYGEVLPHAAKVRWRTTAVDARWAARASESLTITPQVTYRWERPWQARTPDLPDLYYDVTNERVTARVGAAWAAHRAVDVRAGVEASAERGRVNDFDLGMLDYAGRPSVTYRSGAAFAEVDATTPWVNALVGARVDRHSAFGTAFVPRLALTRLFAPFHAKLLVSGAYRAPSIENVNYGTDLKPERTRVFEAEVGWQGGPIYLAANAFHVTIEDPIVFAFDGADVYTNEGETGSRGVEATAELRRGTVTASATWSWYTAVGRNEVAAYAVDGHPDLLLGFAGHKVVAQGTWRPTRHLLVSPAVTWLSPRYGYLSADPGGAPVQGRIGARTAIDLYLAWQDAGVRGLEVGLGVRDALDQGALYVQPYPGGHPPLPGLGREVMARVRWDPPAATR
jgi:outer membrane cobalamin receptor